MPKCAKCGCTVTGYNHIVTRDRGTGFIFCKLCYQERAAAVSKQLNQHQTAKQRRAAKRAKMEVEKNAVKD